ncbi:hypothetical protein KY284_005049 [Solanum tuberosum]|nr:hypothetical protein KY284_005049 [Solanum tuberosum]
MEEGAKGVAWGPLHPIKSSQNLLHVFEDIPKCRAIPNGYLFLEEVYGPIQSVLVVETVLDKRLEGWVPTLHGFHSKRFSTFFGIVIVKSYEHRIVVGLGPGEIGYHRVREEFYPRVVCNTPI